MKGMLVMKKVMLKRSLALGAIMAFVITGNAMAAVEINTSGEYTYNEPTTDIHVVVNPAFKYDIDITAENHTLNFISSEKVNHGLKFDSLNSGEITINGQTISFQGKKEADYSYGILLQNANTANVYGTNITFYGNNTGIRAVGNSVLNLGNTNTENIIVEAGSSRSITLEDGSIANIVGKEVEVKGGIRLAGSSVINFGTESDKAGSVNLKEGITVTSGAKLNVNSYNFDSKTVTISEAGQKTNVNLISDNVNIGYLDVNRGDVMIDATKLVLGAEGNTSDAIHVKSFDSVTGNANINADNIIINGDINTTDRDGGTVNINKDIDNATVVINGDIKTGYDYNNPVTDGEGSYETNNSNVNINLTGQNSMLNGNIYDYNIGKNAQGTVANTGTNISFRNGATWNVTGDSIVKNIIANNANINLKGNDRQNIYIETLNGSDNDITVNILDEAQITIGTNNSTGLQVTGTSEATSQFNRNDLAGSLQDLADTVSIGSGNQLDSVLAQESDIIGETTALVDEYGNIIANTVIEKGHIANEGITELANVAFMAWRAENDEMHQRMGELRSSNGEAGIWARMKRGESKYGDMDIKNQYSTYQLGYDEKVGDSNWYIGGAISRTEGKSSFATGSGENQSTGFTVYGTYVADDGQYIDLSAKYARLDNEFDVFGRSGIESTGDYRNNGYAFSAEYGKRIEAGNDFWVEPQVQLTYGHLSSANYTTSRDVRVTQDAMDSVVGRLGFAAGKDIGAGNVYVKASYLYDFDGDTNVKMTDGKNNAVYDQDLGGGWFEVGIGTNINLSETSHLYFDVEKTYGGDIETPWQWNAGVRFYF